MRRGRGLILRNRKREYPWGENNAGVHSQKEGVCP